MEVACLRVGTCAGATERPVNLQVRARGYSRSCFALFACKAGGQEPHIWLAGQIGLDCASAYLSEICITKLVSQVSKSAGINMHHMLLAFLKPRSEISMDTDGDGLLCVAEARDSTGLT